MRIIRDVRPLTPVCNAKVQINSNNANKIRFYFIKKVIICIYFENMRIFMHKNIGYAHINCKRSIVI